MSDELDALDKAWGGVAPAQPGTGGQYDPLPDGTKAKLRVTKQKPSRIGENHTAVCKVTFEVVSATTPTGSEIPDAPGHKVWHDFWITQANLPYLKRDLGIMEWKGDRVSSLMEESDSSLLNLGAAVELGVEPFVDGQGRDREKNIIRYFEAPFSPPAPGQTVQEDNDIPF